MDEDIPQKSAIEKMRAVKGNNKLTNFAHEVELSRTHSLL